MDTSVSVRLLATSTLVFALALSGCERQDSGSASEAESAEGTDPPGEAHGELRGFVVLADGAELFRRPSADAPHVTFRAPTPSNSDAPAFGAFEIIEPDGDDERIRGTWVKLRNLSAEHGAQHCVGGWAALDPFELEVWARRTDIRQVTRRAVLVDDGAGNSAMLSAGIPVRRSYTDAGAARYTLAPLGLQADIDASAVGLSYQPGPLFPDRSAIAVRPPTAPPLRFEGVEVEGALLHQLDVDGDGGLAVYGRDTEGGTESITVGHRCAELRLVETSPAAPWLSEVVPPDARAPAKSRETESSAESDKRYRVRADAPMFWTDAESAGRVRAAHTFVRAPTIDSDKRCFDLGIGGFRLCFRARDIETLESKAPLGGVIAEGVAPTDLVPGLDEAGGVGGILGTLKDEGSPPPEVGGLDEAGPEPESELPEEEEEADEEEAGEEEAGGSESSGGDEEEPDTEPDPGPATVRPPSSSTPKARLELGKLRVRGSLDKAVLRRVIRPHRGELRRCYQRHGLDADPTSKGSITLSLTISPSGDVKATKTKADTTGTPEIGKCMAKAAKHWGFPKPLGGGLVLLQIRLLLEPR